MAKGLGELESKQILSSRVIWVDGGSRAGLMRGGVVEVSGEQAAEVKGVKVWVLGRDANGAPAITNWEIGATTEEVEHGIHYDRAKALAEDAGYEGDLSVFDEFDPAGKYLKGLEGVGVVAQAVIPGDEGLPEWEVPVAVDVSMSAEVRVRAGSQEEALEVAKKFAASQEGWGMLEVDDEVVRRPCDFYCPDKDAVRVAQAGEGDD